MLSPSYPFRTSRWLPCSIDPRERKNPNSQRRRDVWRRCIAISQRRVMERHGRHKVWHGPDKLAPYDFLIDDLLGRPSLSTNSLISSPTIRGDLSSDDVLAASSPSPAVVWLRDMDGSCIASSLHRSRSRTFLLPPQPSRTGFFPLIHASPDR
jgi:hypothetical protein